MNCKLSAVLTTCRRRFVKITCTRCYRTYSHGYGKLGCLGFGNFEATSKATQIPDLVDVDIVQISAGWGHTVAVTVTGQMLVWGRPFELGDLLRLKRVHDSPIGFLSWIYNKLILMPFHYNGSGLYLEPSLFVCGVQEDGTGEADPVQSVVAGFGLTAAITENGDIYTMGENRWGQCGVGRPNVLILRPLPLDIKERPFFIQAALGLQHGVGLCEEGEVWSWGKGERGQLGTGEPAFRAMFSKSPSKVTLPEPIGFIDCGVAHSIAVSKEGGRLYVWGKFQSPVRKDEVIFNDQFVPRLIEFESPVIAACCTLTQTFVLTADGKVFAMGSSSDKKEMIHEPVHATTVNAAVSFMKARDYCISVNADGTMEELRLTSTGVVSLPFQPPGFEHIPLADLADYSEGWHHSVALVHDPQPLLKDSPESVKEEKPKQEPPLLQ